MIHTCPHCLKQFDPDAPDYIRCECGRLNTVSRLRDDKNPAICPVCSAYLFWRDGKPIIKTMRRKKP